MAINCGVADRHVSGFLKPCWSAGRCTTSHLTRTVAGALKLIEDLERVPSKYFKKMVNTADLWEVRATSGSNIFRLIGFFDGSNLVILAHAFQKKTQKTPKRAIKIAEERKKDYFRRKKK